METYTGERWILERHEAMIRTAEARSRLLGTCPPSGISVWLAVRLRHLADRLEGDAHLETAPQ
jgi:hypothetical protein